MWDQQNSYHCLALRDVRISVRLGAFAAEQGNLSARVQVGELRRAVEALDLDRDAARKTFARFVPESGRVVMETIQWWLDPSMASAAPVYKIKAPVLALYGLDFAQLVGKDRQLKLF